MSKLKEVLSSELFGNVKSISDNNNRYLNMILSQADEYVNISPMQFYRDWCIGKDSVLELISQSLVRDYPVERISGNKTPRIFLSSLLSFSITEYVKSEYGYIIDFNKKGFLNYDKTLYYNLAFVTIAMLVNKYKAETLYKEHIIFLCIKVILTYFKVYEGKVFLCNLSTIKEVAETILETEMERFYSFAEKYGFRFVDNQNTHTRKRRTLTEEQVREFIAPGDTQTMIKEKIMKWCPCSERKARAIMKEYGLTKDKYTRNDNKKKHTEQNFVEERLGEIIPH